MVVTLAKISYRISGKDTKFFYKLITLNSKESVHWSMITDIYTNFVQILYR